MEDDKLQFEVKPQTHRGTIRLRKRATATANSTGVDVSPTNSKPEHSQLAERQDQSRPSALRRAVSKLSFSSKKDQLHKWSQKWSQQIEQTANGLMPVQTDPAVFQLYPWGKLRAHTDDLVQKLKLNEIDQENFLLYELIATHNSPVTALAACSHLLSQQGVRDVLSEVSRSGDTALYLQSYVAAAHGNYETFPREGDERWAAELVTSAGECLSQEPNIHTVESLLELMADFSLPSDHILQKLAKDVIANLYRAAGSILSTCKDSDPPDLVRSIPVATGLRELMRRSDMPPHMWELLDDSVADWRHWAEWRPDKKRLETWRKSAEDWPNPMWHFLSPDFEKDGRIYSSALKRIIAEDGLATWLREHSLVPGDDLEWADPRDTEEFAGVLMSVMDVVCEKGGIYAAFLRHLLLDRRIGLDLHILELWLTAKKHFFLNHAPFFGVVLQGGSGKVPNIRDIEAGLVTMDNVACKHLRAYLRPQIETAMRTIAEYLHRAFVSKLRSAGDWLPIARPLEYFRAILSRFPWLDDLDVPGVNIKHSIDNKSLERLQQLQTALSPSKSDLSSAMVPYIEASVLGVKCKDSRAFRLLRTLHSVSASMAHCRAAIAIVTIDEFDLSHRETLIRYLSNWTLKRVQKLEACLSWPNATGSTQTCQRIVRLSAQALERCERHRSLWTMLALHVMGRWSLHPNSFEARNFTNCSLKKYRNWVTNLEKVFGAFIPGLQEASVWTEKLAGHAHTLQVLRSLPGAADALHCIFLGSSKPYSVLILDMLQSIKDEQENEKLEMKLYLVLAFGLYEEIAEAVSSAVVLLSGVSQAAFARCKALVTISDQDSKEIAAVQLQVWLQTSGAADRTSQKLLTCLGKALRLEPVTKPAVAKEFFARRVSSLLKNAEALEDMKYRVKIKDPQDLKDALGRLGIEDSSSPAEDEVVKLPASLQPFIKQADHHVVDLTFPLHSMNDIRRLAMGVSKGDKLVVRLHLNDGGRVESFCAHVVAATVDLQTMKHKPLVISKTSNPPNALQCEGTDTRLGYCIMRRVFGGFKAIRKSPPLPKIYKGIETALVSIGRECIVCVAPLRSYMHRAVICSDKACLKEWIRSSLDVRLADVRVNEGAVELLLAAIWAAASATSSTGLDLLPDCPSGLNDPAKLVTLLDTIPSVKTGLQTLSTIRNRYTFRAELLLSWACNGFRGFLTEATGTFIIPHMRGVKQFVVADSSPEVTAAFAKWDTVAQRTVFFHGTGFDRLYSILYRGLIVCSHTALQAHGAAGGAGIYLAEQPQTSMGYASGVMQTSQFTAQHSDYANKVVLLGVEYAGNPGSNVHVASDASKCCVRYVFLCPPGFRPPSAAKIAPAMMNSFDALRQGAKSTHATV